MGRYQTVLTAGNTPGRTEREARRAAKDPSRQHSKTSTISHSSAPRESIRTAPLEDIVEESIIAAERPSGSISDSSTPSESLRSALGKVPLFKDPIDTNTRPSGAISVSRSKRASFLSAPVEDRIVKDPSGAAKRPFSSISGSSAPRESFLAAPADDRIIKNPTGAVKRPPSPISVSLASPENVRSASVEGCERPPKIIKTTASTGSAIDLASLFPGPRFLVGTGNNPYVIDLKDRDIAYKLLFREGGDDCEPPYSNAYWGWLGLQHAYPPNLAIFDNELACKQELSCLIREVREALQFDHGACSPRKKEVIGKWLAQLEEEYHILAARPLHYILRFDGYEFKVYHKYYEEEIDVNEADDKEHTDDDAEDDGYDTEQEEYEAGVDFAHNDDEGLGDMYP